MYIFVIKNCDEEGHIRVLCLLSIFSYRIDVPSERLYLSDFVPQSVNCGMFLSSKPKPQVQARNCGINVTGEASTCVK